MPAAAGIDAPLVDRLDAEAVAGAFPGADAVGEISGEPPIAEVLRDGQVVGTLVSTHDTVASTGYAGAPFDLIVGLDLEGALRGVFLREHHEPILGPSLIRTGLMQAFLDRLQGLRIGRSRRPGRGAMDGISGATISAKLMRSAAILSARKAVSRTGIIGAGSDPRGLSIDLNRFSEKRWRDLVASGEVVGMTVTNADVATAFAGAAAAVGEGQGSLLEVFVMLGTPAGIGRNLFGANWHNYHLSQIAADEHILVIAARGRYLLRERSGVFASGFPRIRVSQDGRRIRLGFDNELRRTALRAAGAPRFREYMTFRIGGDDGFDALSPWELEVVVEAAAVGAPEDAAPAVFALPYRLPADYVLGDDYALEEAGFKTPRTTLFGLLRESTLSEWQQVWVERAVDIALLAGLLAALTAIFIFQDRLARRRRLLNAIRVVFLAVVLLWLGWLKDAQLTTINILAYGQAALGGMDWVLFLLDPLIFILSAYVVLSLVLWGRGVYCGWLCPFGALQELLARLARLVRIPQVSVPERLQERLWMIKYVIVAVIFGLAAWSMNAAVKAAEVEPFKTAIIVGFDRGWPYLAYAGALLVAGLFVERFFCRFLCPLGGALSILGRARLLTTLKRRPQCGNPCTLCQSSCPIGAIKSDGAIDMSECLQYLDCQAEYFDDTRCPPLVAVRKQGARAVLVAAG